MDPKDFDQNQFDRGRKYTFDLDLDPIAKGVTLPVLLIRGRRGGKTLVATASVHGDEYEGVRAILDTFANLSPDDMSGDLLAVPVANPPAFWNGSRTSPTDDKDLARVFPGRTDSGPTEAIAYVLANSIISRADFYVDLHSAGVKQLMPTLVGYNATDALSRSAALAFGASVLWAHPDVPPGRTISFAQSRSIPWIYTEARGAGRIDAADLRVFCEGIKNLLRHLSILSGRPKVPPIDFHLYGNGDTDNSLVSTQRGVLIPRVELLQEVSVGEELGRTINLRGELLETFRAPSSGSVALIRQCITVEPGDAVFLVTHLYA